MFVGQHSSDWLENLPFVPDHDGHTNESGTATHLDSNVVYDNSTEGRKVLASHLLHESLHLVDSHFTPERFRHPKPGQSGYPDFDSSHMYTSPPYSYVNLSSTGAVCVDWN